MSSGSSSVVLDPLSAAFGPPPVLPPPSTPTPPLGSPRNFKAVQHTDWATCFCVVKFDIELGQTMEYSYPPQSFSEEESTNICFLSFPDSNSGGNNDLVFSFRTPMRPAPSHHDSSSPSPASSPSHHPSSAGNHWPKILAASTTPNISADADTGDGFLYGYVFFRQERDARLARGYMQKSVVLLTRFPFVGLYRRVVSAVGNMFFEYGHTLLEASYQNMACWPPPRPGHTFDLPILGSLLTFHVPYTTHVSGAGSAPHIVDPGRNAIHPSLPKDQLVSNLHSINIYSVFKDIASKLWLLWELVLLGEPLLVVSTSPAGCSDAVLGLVSLISPIRYCGDYRPYFTIHDSDFKEYTSFTDEPFPSIILGVTNPFFLKALDHWPHVVNVGGPPTKPVNIKPTPSPAKPAAGGFMGGWNSGVTSMIGGMMGTAAAGMEKLRKIQDPVTKHITEHKAGVQTQHKASVSSDKKVTKQLSDSLSSDPLSSSPPAIMASSPGGGPSPLTLAVNNELLRRHFLQLTEAFLIPLERYFATLLPQTRTVSLFARPPRLRTFNEDEFMTLLADMSDKHYVIENKTKEQDLYRRFIHSNNFRGWFSDKRQEAISHLNLLYRRAILKADVQTVLAGKSHRDLVDLYMRMRDQLTLETTRALPDEGVAEKIDSIINAVTAALPKEATLNLPLLPRASASLPSPPVDADPLGATTVPATPTNAEPTPANKETSAPADPLGATL